MRNALLVTILALTTTAHAAAPKKAESKAEEAKKDGPVSMVLCAPGYAGSTKEAQPSIDALMKALAQSAKWDGKDLLGAYYETDKDGIAALSKPDAALAMVTLAFFLEQQDAAKLTPRMLASMKDRPAMERWALAAKKGTVKDAASLDGFTIASGISFSPRFVRGPVLGAWGKLPESVKFPVPFLIRERMPVPVSSMTPANVGLVASPKVRVWLVAPVRRTSEPATPEREAIVSL